MEVKFFRCEICGNIIVKVIDSSVVPSCCGKPMVELTAKTADMGREKHVPVVERIDEKTIKVKVGDVEHPMLAEHHIEFIAIETEDGCQVVKLQAGNVPQAFFTSYAKLKAVYEYCNLHGLWKTTVE